MKYLGKIQRIENVAMPLFYDVKCHVSVPKFRLRYTI